jgi:hypothetical protein
MSELKRNVDFQFGPRKMQVASSARGIDESQPRQTLEIAQAKEFLAGSWDMGGDPYNSVGARATKSRAA